MAISFKPAQYHTVTPYICVDGGASDLIEFMKTIFGATEVFRMGGPEGKVGHAEIKIGDSTLMVSDYKPKSGFLYVYVPDVDATYAKALAAGAKSVGAPTNQFYGDRSAGFEDQWGNHWGIATHIEDVSPEELQRRHQEMFASGKKS